jgi:hypothetical protein
MGIAIDDDAVGDQAGLPSAVSLERAGQQFVLRLGQFGRADGLVAQAGDLRSARPSPSATGLPLAIIA